MARRRRPRAKGDTTGGPVRRLWPALFVLFVFALGVWVGYLFSPHGERRPLKPVPPTLPEEHAESPRGEVPLNFPVPHPAPRAVVSVIIDDIGYKQGDVRRFSSLPFPVTLSIVPFSPFDLYSARYAHRMGKTVMVHLPMEPNHTGEKIELLERRTRGMLLTGMGDAALRRLVGKELSRIPFAVAANNHMGSRFTASARCMRLVLSEVKRRGMFFVDSRTTSKSVACSLGRRLGVVVLKRDIFLDNSRTEEYIASQLEQLARVALKRGYAIAIGHPHQVTYRALLRKLPELEKRGIRVVPIDYIYRGVLEGRYEGCL